MTSSSASHLSLNKSHRGFPRAPAHVLAQGSICGAPRRLPLLTMQTYTLNRFKGTPICRPFAGRPKFVLFMPPQPPLLTGDIILGLFLVVGIFFYKFPPFVHVMVLNAN